MASNNVPSRSADLEPLKHALRESDEATQSAVEQITSLCRAAQARLAMDPQALADVHVLLATISDLALTVENEVNATAEKFGCNWSEGLSAYSRFAAMTVPPEHAAG
jgi:hypothetical protein